MILGIISDIHANYEALDAVLEKCLLLGVHKYICLGDIVGYNSSPVECLDRVRKLPIIMWVRGNHDEYAALDIPLEGINKLARESIYWTRSVLSDEDKKWLRTRGYKSVNLKERITAVHGTLDSPELWNYIFDENNAEVNFMLQMTQSCFFGHTHLPVLFEKESMASDDNNGKVKRVMTWQTLSRKQESFMFCLNRDSKYLINPGSVGQPRNGDPRASFAVFDTDRGVLVRHAVNYDIASAQEKIRQTHGLEALAFRLSAGR